MGQATNHITNGLLLRADLHLLFDLGLVRLNSDLTITISPRLYNTEYHYYDGKTINLPANQHHYPSLFALKERSKLFND